MISRSTDIRAALRSRQRGFLLMRFMAMGGGFTPARLFAAGEQGVWFDPSDFSTMFQDSAGTTPVTSVEQPVGKILDKSGRGNHATQGTSAARPTLKVDATGRYYLNFDGVDDGMSGTSWAGFTASTLAVGVESLAAPGTSYLCAFTVPNQVIYANTADGQWGGFNINPVLSGYACDSSTGARVLVMASRAANDVDLYTDAHAKVTVATGTSYNNRGLFLGSAASGIQLMNGRIYQALAIGRVLTAEEILSVQRYLAWKSGVSL